MHSSSAEMETCEVAFVKKNSQISWLPYCPKTQQFKFSRIIGEKITNFRWRQILKERYGEFSSLCCLVDERTAKRIVLNDGIKPKVSRVSAWVKTGRKMNLELPFVLFTPNTEKQVYLSYNGVFINQRDFRDLTIKVVIGLNGDEGIVDQQFGSNDKEDKTDDDIFYWNHYFLDMIDTETRTICRILASKNIYNNLLRYDPTELGGPWYWDFTNNIHYCLKRTRGSDGRERLVILEFLRESDVIGLSKPGPDWSVIRDIEFGCSDAVVEMDHGGEKGKATCEQLQQFLSWYNSLPSDKLRKLDDIPGLRKAKMLRC